MPEIKSWEDACALLKIDSTALPIVDHLPEEDRDYITAHYQMVVITRALNFDRKAKKVWFPDWSNYSEYKYWPWFFMGGDDPAGFGFAASGSAYGDAGVGSRLCFRTRALSDYAAKRFVDLYRRFMVIPKR